MTYDVQASISDPNLVITVRPDDIEIRCGNSTDKTIPAINLPPYSATVRNNGIPVQSYNIPQHDRFARWLHFLTPDSIVRSQQQIVSQGLMLPFGTPGKKSPAAPTNKYTGPLSTAGISTNMGATGERWDIGLIPEWEAEYMRTGNAAPMLEAAKGFFSMPTKIVDERTGRFWDLTVHTMATLFWQDSNAIPSATPGQWSMNLPHHPAIYIAYLVTGKLRYLEELQAFVNWGFLITNWYVSIMGYPICNLAEMRGFWWHFRSLLYCYMATVQAEKDYPGGLPAPLLPSSLWLKHIDNQYALMQKWVTDPANQVFRYFPDVTGFRPWQYDYGLETMATAALFFPNSKWIQVFTWMMGNPVARLNGKSGWPRRYQTPYQLRTGPNMPQEGDNNWPPPNYKSSDYYDTWGAAWQGHVKEIWSVAPADGYNMSQTKIDTLLADPSTTDTLVSWDPYPMQTLRSVMAAADVLDKNGLAPIRSTYPEFDDCYSFVTAMVLDWESQSPNNIIASRVSIVSATITPPSTQGVISMSLNGNLHIGQSEAFTVAFKDGTGADVPPPSDLAYKAAPDGIITITPSPTGGTVDALAQGTFTLTASAAGFADATLTGSVSPLGVISLAWA